MGVNVGVCSSLTGSFDVGPDLTANRLLLAIAMQRFIVYVYVS
jgi:hypothetical protein